LHAALLGGDRITSTGSAIVAKLQTFSYDGDRKNFNFDKYVTLHVEQHNIHADLTEYGVTPLDESFKILWLWFQNGIKCSALDAVKASINTNKALFTRFDSVEDAYVDFKRTLTPISDPRTRQVATVGTGRGGVGRGGTHKKCDFSNCLKIYSELSNMLS